MKFVFWRVYKMKDQLKRKLSTAYQRITGWITGLETRDEQNRVEEASRYLSTHDILTGLYTRAYFEEEMARLESEGEFPVSIVMADVDGKGANNNIQGQAAGNEVLRLTVLVIRNAFRAEDVVARIGEDGFAVLLPNTDTATVKEILKRIRYSVMAQNRAYAHLPLNLFLGAATAEKGDSLATTLKQAEREMSLEREKGSFLANTAGRKQKRWPQVERLMNPWKSSPSLLMGEEIFRNYFIRSGSK
jgi:diguanylate cyclase (GGDEF)-like protein